MKANKNQFILLHRAVNNTPVIINTDYILTVYRDTVDNDELEGVMKTCIVLSETDDDDEQIIIFVNESVERVYNVMMGITKKE